MKLTGFAALVFMALVSVITLAIYGGLGYVIFHFIHKLW